MSVEIDILIRQFDNFNIAHKIERLRSISISNMQKWENSIEKDKAIENKNKELDQLKKNIIHQNICLTGIQIYLNLNIKQWIFIKIL